LDDRKLQADAHAVVGHHFDIEGVARDGTGRASPEKLKRD
jgi:hypothetical protein